jgi:hypothetical protein
MLAALSALAGSANGTPVLDQNHIITSSIADTPSDAQEVGQTFTVGITGTLTQIDVLLGRFGFASGDAQLTVYSTASGFPSTSLGFVSIPAASVPTSSPTYIPVDLTSLNIPVTASDVLSFAVKNTGSGPYLMPYVSPPPPTYSGGSGVRRTLSVPPGPWQNYSPERDFGFRNYVEPAAAGLPGDFNDDGTVDAADYVTWRKHFGEPNEDALHGNGDNMNGVDQGDHNLWRQRFAARGSGSSGSGAPVPEPGTAILLIAGAFCVLRTQRRRK